jgi:acetyltransferase
VDGFGYLAAYRRNQSKLLQAPTPLSEHQEPDIDGARLMIQDVIE